MGYPLVSTGAAVPCLQSAGDALVKQEIPHFLLGQSLWEAATRHWDLGPGLEPPTAATSREQRVATDPWASPSVTIQHKSCNFIASLRPDGSFS